MDKLAAAAIVIFLLIYVLPRLLAVIGLGLALPVDALIMEVGFTNPVVGWFVFGASFGAAVALVQLGRKYRATVLMASGILLVAALVLASAVGYSRATAHYVALTEGANATTPITGESLMVVIGDNVNVRTGPSTSTEITTFLVRDQQVQVIASGGEWRQVRMAFDGSAVLGWVHSRFLGAGNSRPAATPTVDSTPTSCGTLRC